MKEQRGGEELHRQAFGAYYQREAPQPVLRIPPLSSCKTSTKSCHIHDVMNSLIISTNRPHSQGSNRNVLLRNRVHVAEATLLIRDVAYLQPTLELCINGLVLT